MVVVRLGQGVDATGCFADEAIERTRVALARYASTMRELGVERVDMVATSATRDAGNRDEFFAMTAELLSTVEPGAVARVISGDEEARLSFRGAVGDLDPALGPFAVTDLGGGSTELVVGDASGVRAAYSADVGVSGPPSVVCAVTRRLTKRSPRHGNSSRSAWRQRSRPSTCPACGLGSA